MTVSGRKKARGKLTPDERRIVDDIGESTKAFGTWPAAPEMIPVDLAARAAERAYRRGVTQGAWYMFWHLNPRLRDDRTRPAFLDRLTRWRQHGISQDHAKAEIPPGWSTPCRWTR